MAELIQLLGILKDNPTQLTATLTALFVAGTLWLNSRKANLDLMTSINKSQSDSLASMTEQNEKLTEKLFEMQRQLVQQLEIVDKLGDELRKTRNELHDTRKHILQLEGLVKKYQEGCVGCSHMNKEEIL
jgi:DNA repair ATPase RecN